MLHGRTSTNTNADGLHKPCCNYVTEHNTNAIGKCNGNGVFLSIVHPSPDTIINPFLHLFTYRISYFNESPYHGSHVHSNLNFINILQSHHVSINHTLCDTITDGKVDSNFDPIIDRFSNNTLHFNSKWNCNPYSYPNLHFVGVPKSNHVGVRYSFSTPNHDR